MQGDTNLITCCYLILMNTDDVLLMMLKVANNKTANALQMLFHLYCIIVATNQTQALGLYISPTNTCTHGVETRNCRWKQGYAVSSVEVGGLARSDPCHCSALLAASRCVFVFQKAKKGRCGLVQTMFRAHQLCHISPGCTIFPVFSCPTM